MKPTPIERLIAGQPLERRARHEAAKRERGLVRVSRWVPAGAVSAVDQAIAAAIHVQAADDAMIAAVFRRVADALEPPSGNTGVIGSD